MKSGTQRAALILAALTCLLASTRALAIHPAGGPPEPPGTPALDASDPATGQDAPDGASTEDRSWLAPSSKEAGLASISTTRGSGFTWLAVLFIAALGAGALWLRRHKRKASPIGAVEARLTLLSSTRVGPKAYAVSAEVNGRVLLLGVTDHSVTRLGWLDPPELEVAAPAEEAEPEPEAAAAGADPDELPDDYPGSSLRAAALRTSPLTSSYNLRRFQEVLLGVDRDPVRSSRIPVARPDTPGHSAPPVGSDAATTLAALTNDVFQSDIAPAGRSVAPASLRRKRQRRQELPSKAPKATPQAAAGANAQNALEGQVAGLRALKNG